MMYEIFKNQDSHSQKNKNINVSQFSMSQVCNLDLRSVQCQSARLLHDSGGRKIKPINWIFMCHNRFWQNNSVQTGTVFETHLYNIQQWWPSAAVCYFLNKQEVCCALSVFRLKDLTWWQAYTSCFREICGFPADFPWILQISLILQVSYDSVDFIEICGFYPPLFYGRC